MQPLVNQLQTTFPQVSFRAGEQFYWSPESSEIVFNQNASGPKADWALLHETSHALLDHRNYANDFALISMEVAAWDYAQQLAKKLKLAIIDENHIQDCLDTYRDWLHRRCSCPQCGTRSLQRDGSQYGCHNCTMTWHVSPSRFCRTYRLVSSTDENSPTL